MAKLRDITKKIVDVVHCPRMSFKFDDELLKDVGRELKRRKSRSFAIPKEDFLPAFGRDPADKTTPGSITYCINEHLRDPDKPYRKHGIKVGIHTDKATGKLMFKFIMVDWDEWDEEHSRTEVEE